VLARRLAAQLLAGPPAPDPPAAVGRLLALQAQDGRGARLAVRARTRAGTVATLEKALTEDRTLLVTWLCRGTLHLIRSEDYHWLHALTAPPLFTGNLRRLEQTGVSPAAAERGLEVIERSLAADGPLTRRQLEERIAARGIPTKDQALVHLDGSYSSHS
jgi:Winged helix DNA-binding domain